MSSLSITSPFARFENPPLTDIGDSRLSKRPFKIFCDFLGTKDFPKIFNYGVKWAERTVEFVSPGTAISPEVRGFGEFAGRVKNFMSMTKIVASLEEVRSSVGKLWGKFKNCQESTRSEIATAFRHVIRKTSDCCNNVCDGIKLIGSFFPFKYMPYVDVFSAGWTFAGSASNLADDAIKASKAGTTPEKILHGLSIGMDISYLIVGGLGLYAFFFSAPISIVLVPLTTALVCSISRFFFNEIKDPEHKNQDSSQVLQALEWSLQRTALPNG